MSGTVELLDKNMIKQSKIKVATFPVRWRHYFGLFLITLLELRWPVKLAWVYLSFKMRSITRICFYLHRVESNNVYFIKKTQIGY